MTIRSAIHNAITSKNTDDKFVAKRIGEIITQLGTPGKGHLDVVLTDTEHTLLSLAIEKQFYQSAIKLITSGASPTCEPAGYESPLCTLASESGEQKHQQASEKDVFHRLCQLALEKSSTDALKELKTEIEKNSSDIEYAPWFKTLLNNTINTRAEKQKDQITNEAHCKANRKIAVGSVAIVLGVATMAAASTGAVYLAIEGASQFAQHFALLSTQLSTAMTNMTWIAPAAIALVALIGIAVYAVGVQKAHSGNIRKQEIKMNPNCVFDKPQEKTRSSSDTDCTQ